jgi:hypothetical protein
VKVGPWRRCRPWRSATPLRRHPHACKLPVSHRTATTKRMSPTGDQLTYP